MSTMRGSQLKFTALPVGPCYPRPEVPLGEILYIHRGLEALPLQLGIDLDNCHWALSDHGFYSGNYVSTIRYLTTPFQ